MSGREGARLSQLCLIFIDLTDELTDPTEEIKELAFQWKSASRSTHGGPTTNFTEEGPFITMLRRQREHNWRSAEKKGLKRIRNV